MARSALRLFAALIVAGACFISNAQAQQAYPERAVRFILPFGPGSATDIAARLIGEKLQAKWGKPVVVEPRPGGDGLIAINAFLTANDDHTLLYASTASFIVHPYTLQSKPPYDAERDLNPIVRTADSGLAVAVSAGSGAHSIKDFVELARKNPGKLNAAGGAGLAELTVRAFLKEQGLNVSMVPYRDIVQAGVDLGENRIQLLSSSLSIAMPFVQAGKARFAAIAAPARSPLLPDVPTVGEALPGFEAQSWVGLLAPAGTPRPVVDKLHANRARILATPDIREKFESQGAEVVAGGTEAFAAWIRAESARWGKVIRERNIKLD